MTDKKIIAIVGGTGHQGGGLVRAILDDPDGPFAARVLTRHPDSANAQELRKRGAEIVRGDLDDEASLRAAFDGAYGAFVYTNHYDPQAPEDAANRSRARRELDQAANAATAAKAAHLRHVVWSTLEDTRPHFAHLGSDAPVIEDDYTVPHFDAKGAGNAEFLSRGVPTTILETTLFYEAFLTTRKPRREPDGQLVVSLPLGDGTLSMVAAEDIGRTAYGIFRTGAGLVGRTVSIAGDVNTGDDVAETLTRVLGEKVLYRPVTPQELRATGLPFSGETANMYQFYNEASDLLIAKRDPAALRATLNPRLQSLEDWMTEHRDELMP
ncbi:NmrA family NAD(P)-binding protein [Actinoplanes sp. TBRC 11911]|uniref:NmrA family NAD(P)-binding protein n=1 Tax=Actinoplanes sp. TBRC 11911 TaxID=2729386 RepID=UPI00145F9170|nr:NmrA family NAD(P)-binding protein [Actinoplanes sp. TBRC 11911]NMO51706.1 NmrA family NAD(P)-binding protein [Actinoplanes sp. TBRC 11911]